MVDITLHSLTILVGTTASGKTKWATDNFSSWEIISPELIRLELFGRADAFQHESYVWKELVQRVEKRLLWGSRVVVDATNLKKQDRDCFLAVAKKTGVPLYVICFERDTEQKIKILTRDGVTHHDALAILQKQEQTMRSHARSLLALDGQDAKVCKSTAVGRIVQKVEILNNKLLVVGDVHGNISGMQQAIKMAALENRQIVWLGDIVDYGANNLKCVRMVYETVCNNEAVMVWGNHERKITKWIDCDWGKTFNGRMSDANYATVKEILSLSEDRRARFLAVWRALENHSQQCWHKDNWLFTHGAATSQMWHMQGYHRLPQPHSDMAFFGQTDRNHPTKEDGYPNRIWNWVDDVPAGRNVVVGHDWVDRQTNQIVVKINTHGGRVFCVDAGSSKGGRLAALAIDTNTQQTEERYFDT